MPTLKTRQPLETPEAEMTEAQPPASTNSVHSLEPVIGIFQNEPLMEALMERVRADRRAEQDAEKQVTETVQ